MTDWKAVREEFPALRKWTYLNTATYGQLARSTTDAVARHFARRDEFACADFLAWFDDADRIREQIGSLINCGAGDVAFFQNASSALSLLAGAIDWRAGDRVLTLDHEFPNHLYWGEYLAQRGVLFDVVSWDDLPGSLQPNTRLVMASTVNYVTGLRIPCDDLVRRCRAAGALSYLDGTQSLGAIRFDCRAVAPDVFAVDGYKWLLSPNGAGFAYISPEVRRWLPPAVLGWRSDRRWREVNSLHHGNPEFVDAAERYEGGMLPFPAICGMGASIGMMLSIGPEVIERRVLELASNARRILESKGALIAPGETAVVSAKFPDRDAVELVRELRGQGILTAARHGYLRVSTHFYNLEDELDRLDAALAD